jgi:DNA-binding IclR family transcriptional regulator
VSVADQQHGRAKPWYLLSSHGLVLIAVAKEPRARIHDIAADVGMTERACQRILNDLTTSGFLSRKRVRRRNEYTVHMMRNMPHPLTQAHTLAQLLDTLCAEEGRANST